MVSASNIQMLALKFYTNLSSISKQTQVSLFVRMETDRSMDLLTTFQSYALYHIHSQHKNNRLGSASFQSLTFICYEPYVIITDNETVIRSLSFIFMF